MESESVFGVEPDQLSELLSVGEDDHSDSEAKNEPSPGDRSSEAKPESGSGIDAFVEQPGSWVGPYKLLKVLGEGGMGIAYLAEQKRPMRRQVAIKVIKPGMDSRRVVSRFEAERQALALLDHPNIAHVHDAGATELGRPYFVMEYVKGLSLTDYCDHHKLTIKARLDLFLQVCQAIQHAHQKGIIHRDIKPSNILVSVENDRATPKIIDFGVAKAMGRPLTDRTMVTEDSHLLGTPEYMSPEQVDMASEDIDTRSDVYSLGVLLYVLLTGVLPFDYETLRDSGIENIRRTICETDPKTPSTRLTSLGEEAAKVAEMRSTQISTLRKHLKRELEWIPLKAMSKERSERYRSASELADDVENFLKGVPLTAGPPTTLYRLKKFVRRNAVLSAAVLAVAVTLVLGLAGTTAMYLRKERALGDAQATMDFLTKNVLRAVSDANAYEQSVSYALDAASKDLDEGIFEERPLVEASIRGELGWTYRLLGELDKAERHSERALRICEEQLGEGHFQTTQKMFHLGLVYRDQNRWNDAYRMLSRQLEAVQREHATDFHAPYISLGSLFSRMGQYKEAEECFLKKIEIIRREEGEDAAAIIPRRSLAAVYHLQGRYEEAATLYRKVLNTAGWDSGERNRLKCEDSLADVYRDQGRYQDAERLYETTLEKQRRSWGVETVKAMGIMVDLARLYTDQRGYDKADELFKEVEAIIAKRENPRKPTWYLYNLAVLRTKQVRLEEAEPLFEEVRDRWQHTLAELADDHPEMLKIINDFGVLRREQKKYAEAERLLGQALDGRKLKLGDDHPACFESMHELAVLYKVQERYDEAAALLLQAAKGRNLKLGDHHPHTRESIKNLIELYEAWDKPEEAEKWRAKIQGK